MKGAPPRILKKGSAESAAAVERAEDVLAAAHARSQEIVAAAEEDAARLRAQAARELADARAAAVEEGHAEGRGRAAALLARASQAREARLAELDGAVLALALEVARRIVGRELALAPSAAVDVARRALRAAAGCGDVLLHASPDDLAALREADGELRALVDGGALALVDDPTLGRGEVVVEARGGRVDARVEAQLEAFRRALEAEGR